MIECNFVYISEMASRNVLAIFVEASIQSNYALYQDTLSVNNIKVVMKFSFCLNFG